MVNLLTSDFDYNLPEELIAQTPSKTREQSKMMVLNRTKKSLNHKHFFDIVDLLDKNDVLILNNTKVIPARLFGQKTTGAKVEVFLLKDLGKNKWEALLKPSKRINPENVIKISDKLLVKAVELIEGGKWLVELKAQKDIYEVLNVIGNVPLPPYIERKMSDDERKSLDTERYQTVFAKNAGSVAAPTAGLHFTDEILCKLKQKGVKIGYVTLNVGLGTFRPVKADKVLDHKMDTEEYEISKETSQLINTAKAEGKSIVAVGTTTVRTLETCFRKHCEIKACRDSSQLFIYPPQKLNVVDKLLTNFHLPKSTLLMLVSAFAGMGDKTPMAGRDFVIKAYEEAIKNKYRFYSYGDCMFIE